MLCICRDTTSEWSISPANTAATSEWFPIVAGSVLGLLLLTQVRMWNDLPYTVFDIGTLEVFKGAVNHWLHPRLVFLSVFRSAGACGVANTFVKQSCFSHLGLGCWF